MKKISLFLAAGLMIAVAACSDEETTNYGRDAVTQKSGSTIEQLYNKMINSQSYKDEQAAIAIFVGKMNYSGDSSIFDNRTTMLNWINQNINATKFSDFPTAVAEWDNIEILRGITFAQNQGFYLGIGNNPGAYPVDGFPTTTPPISVSECPDCEKALINCTAAANKILRMVEVIVGDSLSNGNISADSAANALTIASAKNQDAIDKCGHTFLDCCND